MPNIREAYISRQGPFSYEIRSLLQPELNGLRLPTFHVDTDPFHHLDTFQVLTSDRGFSDGLLCVLFMETLISAPLNWFFQAEPNSVHCLADLQSMFIREYDPVVSRGATMSDLLKFKQGNNESLHDYLTRWRKATSSCRNLEKEVAAFAFRKGLKPTNFLLRLNLDHPNASYDQVIDRAVSHVRRIYATYGIPRRLQQWAETTPTKRYQGRRKKHGHKMRQKQAVVQFQLNPNSRNRAPSLEAPNNYHYETTPNSILGKRKERVDDSLSQLNVLEPVNDDCSVTEEIGMDCEMVGVGQGNRSALARVTLINKWGNVIYDEFVRPVERIVDFRTQISGIRRWNLRKAKDFGVVRKNVAELIKGRILVGHALRHDLEALLLSHPKEDTRDTAVYQPFKREDGSERALRHLAAEFLGVDIQNGEHCPVEDARAAMQLYQNNRQAWEKSLELQVKY